MTWKDEIVEEVRKVRDEHAAKFDYDISAICEDIRRKQSKSGRKVIRTRKNRDINEQSNVEVLKAA